MKKPLAALTLAPPLGGAPARPHLDPRRARPSFAAAPDVQRAAPLGLQAAPPPAGAPSLRAGARVTR